MNNEAEETVLNGIREAMEVRGYVHMANGRDIGKLLDDLTAAETLLRDLDDYCHIKPATLSERSVWIDQGAALRDRLSSAAS